MSKIIKVSHFADSNRRPTHYECVALPTELKWRCGIDVRLFGKRSVSFQEPPRPERGALANCATPRSSVLAGTRTLDPLIKSQLLYQLSYQDIFFASSYEYCVLCAFGFIVFQITLFLLYSGWDLNPHALAGKGF